jgi:hypothetical protein
MKTIWSKWIKNKGVYPEPSDVMVKVKLRGGRVSKWKATNVNWLVNDRSVEPVDKYKVALDSDWLPNTGSKPSLLKAEWFVEVRHVNGESAMVPVKAVVWANTDSPMDVVQYRFLSKKEPEQSSTPEESHMPAKNKITHKYGKEHLIL